jgi:outer membrane receptor protein involved in Fe transport
VNTNQVGLAQSSVHQNTAAPIVTTGFETELKRDWRDGWMVGLSYSFSHAEFVGSTAGDYRHVGFAPANLGAVKAAAPIYGRVLRAMTRLSLEGSRYDRNELKTDPVQTRFGGSIVWDLVFSGDFERLNATYNVGVYNALDYRYSLSVGFDLRQNGIPQNGRTLLASVKVKIP